MKLIYEVLNVLFLKLLHLHFFTLAVSFNHAECSKWTHSSLEFNSPFHCGLCSSAVSLTRSSSHAKITELPTWQKRRLWILPLSPWQHELGVWAAGLILHSSELLLTLVKRMGVQTIVFSWKWGVKASLRIVGKPPGDMIRALRDCEVFQISWFQLRFF